MYRPQLKTSSVGIPYLSGADIDDIGERLIADFNPELLWNPGQTDIDRFVTGYLGMQQDFMYLSHCGVYLGMTVYRDTARIPVFVPELGYAEYAAAKARTVIIDSGLLADQQEHRYRFTMGHEASHGVLHAPYFLGSIEGGDPYVRCRLDCYDDFSIGTPGAKWTDARRVEWQANRLSSALLMPKSAVHMVAAREPGRGLPGYDQRLAHRVSEMFSVSEEAAYYRIKTLGYID